MKKKNVKKFSLNKHVISEIEQASTKGGTLGGPIISLLCATIEIPGCYHHQNRR